MVIIVVLFSFIINNSLIVPSSGFRNLACWCHGHLKAGARFYQFEVPVLDDFHLITSSLAGQFENNDTITESVKKKTNIVAIALRSLGINY